METRSQRVRASVGRIFAEVLSPERTRRATLIERMTVGRLEWETIERLNRWLELLGRIATVVWAALIAVIILGFDMKDTVANVVNGGDPVRAAVFLAVLAPTIVFFLAHSTIGYMRWRLQRELWRRDVDRLTGDDRPRDSVHPPG